MSRAKFEPRLRRLPGRAIWHVYDDGRRLSTGSTSRVEAEVFLADYLREVERPRLAAISIAEILARYFEDRRARAIPGLERLGWAHRPLVRAFGQKPPSVIGAAETLAYTARRRREGVGDGTARTELQALRAALRWALAEGLILALPRIVLPARPAARVRWLTREEAARLLAGAGAPHVRLFVQIALHTAARSGAILALTWDRVDLAAGIVDFRTPGRGETRKRRVLVPVNPTLAAALAEARAAASSEHVIEWGGVGIARIKHGFADAARRAGLAGVTPHVLRHTAVTWALRDGQDPWAVAGFAGMTVEVLREVYGHHHPDHLREVARSLG